MEPTCLAGHLYRPGEGFSPGWVLHDGARILDAGSGKPPQKPAVEGILMPSFVNAHTHVGDAVARGIDIAGLSLHDVVAPPDGLKHRILRSSPESALAAAMRATIGDMSHLGCRAFVDFREQGERGARLLRDAARDSPVRPIILGRCLDQWDDDEGERILATADGFGLSALHDVAGDAPERMAALARKRGKRFALHLSEGRREDVGRALDLQPDFLVHMVHASPEDLAEVAAERVPVVLCPRSNKLFGPLPNIKAMLDAAVSIALGSDNAMFHAPDPLADARVLGASADERTRLALLDALTRGGRQAAGLPEDEDPFSAGARADLVVLAARGPDPLNALFAPTPPRVAHVTWEARP